MSQTKMTDSMNKIHEKLDLISSRVYKMDKNLAVQNGQVKRNKSDIIANAQTINSNTKEIQNMKGFVTRITAFIGAGVSAFVTLIFSFIKS